MSFKIPCSHCGYDEVQKDIHLHHLVPISIGGDDKHGRKYLCKKCHDILHNMLLKQVWKFVQEKEKAREHIKKFSIWWINK